MTISQFGRLRLPGIAEVNLSGEHCPQACWARHIAEHCSA